MFKCIGISLVLGATFINATLSAGVSDYVQSKIDSLRFSAEISYVLNLGVFLCSSAVVLGEFLAPEDAATALKHHVPYAALVALWSGYKAFCGSYTIRTLDDIENAIAGEQYDNNNVQEFYYYTSSSTVVSD